MAVKSLVPVSSTDDSNVHVYNCSSQIEKTSPGFKSGPMRGKSEKDTITADNGVTVQVHKRDFRFWAVITGLAVANFLASLEHSVVVTSGPTIVSDLDMKENYIWITNAFFVCRYLAVVR